MLAEQNSTNWALAEKSLKRANELDPQDQLVIEYLCVLYLAWKDPLEESDRMDEAKQWLERLAELYPEHKYANFYCGMILSAKARKLLPSYGRFPPLPEPDLASLRTKVSPLLEQASRHLARTLTLDREHAAALHFIDEVTSMQAYLIDPDQAACDLRDKATELFRNQWQAGAAERRTAGPAVPPGPSTTITFRLSPEALAEDRARPFPPNPWRV